MTEPFWPPPPKNAPRPPQLTSSASGIDDVTLLCIIGAVIVGLGLAVLLAYRGTLCKGICVPQYLKDLEWDGEEKQPSAERPSKASYPAEWKSSHQTEEHFAASGESGWLVRASFLRRAPSQSVSAIAEPGELQELQRTLSVSHGALFLSPAVDCTAACLAASLEDHGGIEHSSQQVEEVMKSVASFSSLMASLEGHRALSQLDMEELGSTTLQEIEEIKADISELSPRGEARSRAKYQEEADHVLVAKRRGEITC
ncbi:hypothetical protein CYMTET_30132 [Cymbomonas tetramitiformis]|uniref:Uncharacterized protein n=1 Tax=Cymbomonas tetramitiformis TaxID=36881 RepID=A0AAE0FJP9_9CHLO|nr:hypothetical protein CYMTET_30132 [Cymbomonas tetramitiformis]